MKICILFLGISLFFKAPLFSQCNCSFGDLSYNPWYFDINNFVVGMAYSSIPLVIGTTTDQSTSPLSVGYDQGIKLSVGRKEWPNTAIISTGWIEQGGYDFTDITVPGWGNHQYARIRLRDDGKVGIGVAVPEYNLDVNGTARFSPGPYKVIIDYSAGEPTIRPSVGTWGYLGTVSDYWWKTYTHVLYTDGTYSLSDKRVKNNIESLKNPFEKLNKINAVKFDYTEAAYKGVTGDKKAKLLAKGKNNYGFLAQEVKEVLPQLVDHDDSTDLYYVNYEGLIPILVEAVKELKSDLSQRDEVIKDLNNRVVKLEAIIKNNGNKQKSATNSSEDLSEAESASLFQNNPNPFTENTTIQYYLPDNVNSAILYIYNLQGSQIKNIQLNQRGQGSVTISGSELEAGMYVYALVADGKEIDTKKMILTK